MKSRIKTSVQTQERFILFLERCILYIVIVALLVSYLVDWKAHKDIYREIDSIKDVQIDRTQILQKIIEEMHHVKKILEPESGYTSNK